MAGRGAPPKPAAEKVRRNLEPAPTVVTPDDELRGPELEGDWPRETRKWWDTWRRSAQAQVFLDTDWDFLLDTALMHAAYWGGNLAVAAELRLRVAKMGATPEDRARLRLQATAPGGATPTPAPAANPDRKGRLLKAVQ